MIFEQINTGFDSNFSYLVADDETREGVVFDPSLEPQNILPYIKKHNVKVKYIINTHGHFDHIYGNSFIQKHTKARILRYPETKEGDIIKVGKLEMRILYTPGHYKDSICILIGKKLITGDTLFVGTVGGTGHGFPESSAELHGKSLKRLMELPDDTEIWPGHDYGITPYSTIGKEKKTNPFLQFKTIEEFKMLKGQ